MKKFLSLVLALAMTMSLVTISAGAKDFTDADDIQYVEAVDVMSAIGVVDGDTNGNFNPAGGLTRGAAAKIICNLILGPTTAAELNADTNPYVDVDKNSTFAGYIAYCQKANIISGYADGTFKPAAPLTGYAFMKMLLGALGYDGAVEGYTGANWSINVAKQAIGIGLNDGLKTDFNGSNYVTREEAMLYAFNALQATMVTYETTITVGDVTIAGSKAENVAQTGYKNTMGNAQTLQFAEKYFPKLTVKPEQDAFGRPTNTWTDNKTEIGTYVDYTLLVDYFTAAVSGKEVYETLGKTVVDSYDLYIYVDGNGAGSLGTEINKNNKADLTNTANGVLTEVYVDKDAEQAFVVIMNTYLAQATADYSAKKDSVTLSVYHIDKDGKTYVKGAGQETFTVSGEDFEIADVKDEDFFLVNVADGAVQEMAIPEVVSDVALNAFSKGNSVTAGSETYKYAATIEYAEDVLDAYNSGELKEKTYNLYLDPYGYLIGVDLVSEEDNYVFITGIDSNGSNLSNKNHDAFAIFTDGTTATIQFNANKSSSFTAGPLVNTWCTYTVDKNGVYTLTQVGTAINTANGVKIAQASNDNTVVTIDKKNIDLPGNGTTGSEYYKVYGNDSSIYLTAKLDLVNNGGNNIVISGVDNVTTGVKNASLKSYNDAGVVGLKPSGTAWNSVSTGGSTGGSTGDKVASGVYTLYKHTGYVIAAVVVGQDDAVAKNLVYVTSDTGAAGVNQESYANDEWTWTRKVVFQGEEIELKEVGDSLTYLNTMTKGQVYRVSFNAAGNVIGLDSVPTAANSDPIQVNTIADAVSNLKTADTVVYQQTWNDQVKVPQIKGSTLYVSTTAAQGLFVAEDVNIVLIQNNKNKETTTYETGVNHLESIVAELNAAADGKYDYIVTAFIDDGAVTSIVFEDKNTDGYTAPTTTTAGIMDVDITTPGKVKVTFYTSDTTKTKADFVDAAVAAVENELVAAGNTITGKSYDGSKEYTIDVLNQLGYNLTYKFDTSNLIQLYKVTIKGSTDGTNTFTVDATEAYLAQGETVTVVISGGNWSSCGSTNVKITTSDSTSFSADAGTAPVGTNMKVVLKAGTLSEDCTVTLGWQAATP